MAFLAKKVPKIFPSSKPKKGHEDILSHNHYCNKGNGTSLFRKLARDGGKEDPGPQTPLPNHSEHPEPKRQSPRAEALPCSIGCDCNRNSSECHSSASTIESSPTRTPRETKDLTTLVLPDIPKLVFPSQAESTDHKKITSIPSSLRITPRPGAVPENDFPPPVAVVSVPSRSSFYRPLPPPPSLAACGSSFCDGMVVARCLTHAPPRAGEWDDATIESDLEDDCSLSDPDEPDDKQQHEQLQREINAAQASAIMKPWIDKAARLALLQNRICGNIPENDLSRRSTKTRKQEDIYIPQKIGTEVNFAPLLLQRRRMREAALSNLRPRPEGVLNHRELLAFLEKGRSTSTATATTADALAAAASNTHPSSTNTNTSRGEQEPPTPAPRIVKWHVVRQPCK